MLGVWNKILVDLQHFRAITHRRQVLDLLPKNLTGFDRPSPKAKPRTLPKMESTASQSQHWDFFSDERAEFIDFDEGAGFGLW